MATSAGPMIFSLFVYRGLVGAVPIFTSSYVTLNAHLPLTVVPGKGSTPEMSACVPQATNCPPAPPTAPPMIRRSLTTAQAFLPRRHFSFSFASSRNDCFGPRFYGHGGVDTCRSNLVQKYPPSPLFGCLVLFVSGYPP